MNPRVLLSVALAGSTACASTPRTPAADLVADQVRSGEVSEVGLGCGVEALARGGDDLEDLRVRVKGALDARDRAEARRHASSIQSQMALSEVQRFERDWGLQEDPSVPPRVPGGSTGMAEGSLEAHARASEVGVMNSDLTWRNMESALRRSLRTMESTELDRGLRGFVGMNEAELSAFATMVRSAQVAPGGALVLEDHEALPVGAQESYFALLVLAMEGRAGCSGS